MNYKNGTIIVTGGSRGIGADTVLLLAKQGYDICFTYLKQKQAAEEIIKKVHDIGGRAWAIQADAADLDSAIHIMDNIPSDAAPIVGLVNNAGITSKLNTFAKTDLTTIKHVFDVNVLGVFSLTQKVVQNWLEKDLPGVIVNVSSIAAKLGSPGEYIHYAASKAAIETFTIGLGKELAPNGIRVNCVAPGICLTEIHAASGEPDRANRLAAKIPMGRAGKSKEIAQTIAWLISEESSYMTGAVIPVSGGL